MYLALTRRCPLSCAHCSTSSTMRSEEHPEELFTRFVGTFTPAERPNLLTLTGGEPLLRPRLVHELVQRAHAAGTQVTLGSGMFFAREARIPPLIDQALSGLDHFFISLDRFHEQEVPRAAVFRVMKTLVERGQHLSVMLVGTQPGDPYLTEVISQLRSEFNDRVPMLVTYVGRVGRATDWLEKPAPAPQPDPGAQPCDLLTWPVVRYDGSIVACCNQNVIDGPLPPHLRLGHAATDSWPVIRQRYQRSTMLRALRTFGPVYVDERYNAGKSACKGYCGACQRLSDEPAVAQQVEALFLRPTTQWMEEQVQRQKSERFLVRHTSSEYSHLASLGHEP